MLQATGSMYTGLEYQHENISVRLTCDAFMVKIKLLFRELFLQYKQNRYIN